MFFQLIVLLITTGAAVCDIKDCRERVGNECERDELPREFPATLEDMKRDCKNLQNFLKCVKKVFESCPGSELLVHEVETILNPLKEVCDENSKTYEVLSRQFSCVRPMFDEEEFFTCGQVSLSEDEEKIFEPILTEGNGLLRECGFVMSNIICNSYRISKRCGAELKEPVADLLRKFQRVIYYTECSPEMVNELQPIMETYENILTQMDFETIA